MFVGLQGDLLSRFLSRVITHDVSCVRAQVVIVSFRDRRLMAGLDLNTRAWAFHIHRPEVRWKVGRRDSGVEVWWGGSVVERWQMVEA